MKELNITFEWNETDLGPTAVFCNFYKKLVGARPDIKFNYFDSPKVKLPCWGGASKYGVLFMTIENPKTGRYLLISYYDILSEIFYYAPWTGMDLKGLREVYSSIGVINDDTNFLPMNFINYVPIGYMTAPRNEAIVEKLYQQNLPKKIPTKLRFRGQMSTPFRYYILGDCRFEGIERSIAHMNLEPEDYFKEIAADKINLSLNGHGELCHRDMEILGLGNVMIRPKLTSKFYEPLVSGVHYIGVEFDDIPGGHSNHRALADRILEKFNEVKDKPDLLDTIGKNGREWFERNGKIEKNADILLKVIDFNKLFTN